MLKWSVSFQSYSKSPDCCRNPTKVARWIIDDIYYLLMMISTDNCTVVSTVVKNFTNNCCSTLVADGLSFTHLSTVLCTGTQSVLCHQLLMTTLVGSISDFKYIGGPSFAYTIRHNRSYLCMIHLLHHFWVISASFSFHHLQRKVNKEEGWLFLITVTVSGVIGLNGASGKLSLGLSIN